MTERSEGVGGVDGTRTRGLRRDRPMPTTAHRSRPRKIGVGSSTSWPFKVDRGRVFGNGLQILASAGTFGPANVRKQPRTVGPVLSKIGFSRWLGSAKILVGGLSQFAALLTHMPFRDERHNLSYLGVLYNVRIVNHDVVWPGGHRPPKTGHLPTGSTLSTQRERTADRQAPHPRSSTGSVPKHLSGPVTH
jgi:hypothetical protein